MEKFILDNGINAIIKTNKNTPRTAIVIHIKLSKDEIKSGLYYLITQLLFQGTKTRSSEELASELDENAIELNFEKKADYLRFQILCLNEDIEHALEIFQDIIENSTFNEYKKEIIKIKGELLSDLDSAKIQAQDEYYRTIFRNHSYGTGRQEIINEINTITKEDILKSFEEIKNTFPKNISVVGDITREKIIPLLEKHFNQLKSSEIINERKKAEELSESRITTVKKEDANQAQIFQGWLVPSILNEDCPVILLINTILGSSGLSSRLFLELREKKGLAYTVRSVYEPLILGGNFFVYIATEPKNIKTSIEGFAKEIKKIMTEPVSEEELNNAKNNTIGKRQFYQETNLLEASLKGYYESLGLGYDYEEKLVQSIKKVSAEDIIRVAKKYFSTHNTLCVLAPGKDIKNANFG